MDPLADGEGGIVMNATSDSEQKEVLELLLGRQVISEVTDDRVVRAGVFDMKCTVIIWRS